MTPPAPSRRRILVITPSTDPSEGGVQAASAHLVRTLHRLYGASTVEVISLGELLSQKVGQKGLFGRAFLILRAFIKAVRTTMHTPPHLIILGHLGMSRYAGAVLLVDQCHRGYTQFRGILGAGVSALCPRLRRQSPLSSGRQKAQARDPIQVCCMLHGAELVAPSLSWRLGAKYLEWHQVAVSHWTAKKASQYLRLETRQLSVLGNTFDPNQFYPESRNQDLLTSRGIPSGVPILTSLCRIDNRLRSKGYREVTAAMPIVLRALPEAHYLIAGDGPDRDTFARELSQVTHGNRVHLLGKLPEHQLNQFINLADVFLLMGEEEGFGMVILAALAANIPVIASDEGGCPEVLAQGQGITVPRNDTEALAQAIISVCRGHYRPLTRSTVVREFGPSRYEQSLSEIVSQLIPPLPNRYHH